MYSSVKFFEPTVRVTLPLSGLLWISPAVVLVDDPLPLPPPQALTPLASTMAASTPNRALSRLFMLIAGASLRISICPLLVRALFSGLTGSYAPALARCRISPRGVTSRCRPASVNSTISARSATRIAPASTPSLP